MIINVFTRSVILLIITLFITTTLQNSGTPAKRQTNKATVPVVRRLPPARQAVAAKPGFFKTFFSTIFEQWSETRKTLNEVNSILDKNFLPENPPPTTPPPINTDPNVTTTAAPFKIKRSELIKLLRKNFLGIGRLVDIEVKAALENSNKEWPEYQKNFSREISKWL